jgi:hypothetical protein
VAVAVVNVAVAGIGFVLPLLVTGGALKVTLTGAVPVYITVNVTVTDPLVPRVTEIGMVALPAVPWLRVPI